MDSQDSDLVHDAIRHQAQRLHHQEEQLNQLRQNIIGMASQQENLFSPVSEQLAAQFPKVTMQHLFLFNHLFLPHLLTLFSHPVQSIQTPEIQMTFVSNSVWASVWVTGFPFPKNQVKIVYIISHLTGRAEAWAMAEWRRRSPVCNSFQLFTRTFTQNSQTVSPGREAAQVPYNKEYDESRTKPLSFGLYQPTVGGTIQRW